MGVVRSVLDIMNKRLGLSARIDTVTGEDKLLNRFFWKRMSGGIDSESLDRATNAVRRGGKPKNIESLDVSLEKKNGQGWWEVVTLLGSNHQVLSPFIQRDPHRLSAGGRGRDRSHSTITVYVRGPYSTGMVEAIEL